MAISAETKMTPEYRAGYTTGWTSALRAKVKTDKAADEAARRRDFRERAFLAALSGVFPDARNWLDAKGKPIVDSPGIVHFAKSVAEEAVLGFYK